MASGVRVSVLAETSTYADYLSERLEMEIPVLAWPHAGEQMPLQQRGPLYLILPGLRSSG